MGSLKTHNNIFIQCFLKNWKNITKEETFVLDERKYLLNDQFEFNNETMKKLRLTNDILKKEEQRISQKINHIYSLQEELLVKKLVEDFEVEFELHCLNESYYPKIDRRFEGNPFYVDYIFHLFHQNIKEDIFFTGNWNEFKCNPRHPLVNEFHCYTFHHLYDHTYLAWEDILRIESIWIEMKIVNQFFIDFSPA